MDQKVPLSTEHVDSVSGELHSELKGRSFPEDINQSAIAAAAFEHSLSTRQALRLYPKAIFWSIVLSSACIMEGYDTLLILVSFGLPSFQERFGVLQPDGTRSITAPWQSGLTSAVTCGEIIGLLLNGFVADRFGYRKVMLASLISLFALIFIVFFAGNIQTLLVGQLLCGIPWGIFQILTNTYASEVCPVVLRPYLTTYVNMCWVIGQLIASGVTRAFVNRADVWAFKIPFAIQWAFPIPILVLCIFAPESPWWLVRAGRTQEAEDVVKRLTSAKAGDQLGFDVSRTVAMMVHTNETEKKINFGTSYLDCFKGNNLRRTEIAFGIYSIQMLCGAQLIFSSTYFLEKAGLVAAYSFDITVSQFGIGVIATAVSWLLIARMGRRTLYLCGLVVINAILLAIGGASLASNTSAEWAQGALIIVFTAVYDVSIGPLCFSFVTEIPSTRLRQKTAGMARALYNVFQIICNVLTSYMLNPTGWNWAGKSAFFWLGSCLLMTVWAYIRVPEPRGRTYEELDILFEKRVPARKFGKTEVDLSRDMELISSPE